MLATIVSLVIKGGPNYGIDFRGGTLMYVKFASSRRWTRSARL